MRVYIRQEESNDFVQVEKVVEAAFKAVAISDKTEHLLVARLRKSVAFVPELSLVAEWEKEIVGHILLTKIKIKNKDQNTVSLALAPVSVLPDFQNKGIGGQLIRRAHEIAKDLGFNSIVLLGHEDYYPRFGYERASKYGIQLPFEAPEENCMVLDLAKDTVKDISGMVEYPKAFFE